MTTLLGFTIFGVLVNFDDDGVQGWTMLLYNPSSLACLVWQILMLSLRNTMVDVFTKVVFRRYADLLDWYSDVEERILLEEYENPNQTFSIMQHPGLYKKIHTANILNTLRLINVNMMKCPKTDGLE